MDPMAVALITGAAGIIAGVLGGLIGAFGKPLGEDWAARQREAREAEAERARQRRETLLKVRDSITNLHHYRSAPNDLQVGVAEIDDPQLSEHVGRMLTSSLEREANSAQSDALHRLGRLLGEDRKE
jgi:hypothetical protein